MQFIPLGLLALLRILRLEALEMELVGSGERFEEELGLPAVTVVVETSNVCPENPTRNYFGPVGVRVLERVHSCF